MKNTFWQFRAALWTGTAYDASHAITLRLDRVESAERETKATKVTMMSGLQHVLLIDYEDFMEIVGKAFARES